MSAPAVRLSLTFTSYERLSSGVTVQYPNVLNIRKAQRLLMVEEMNGQQHRHQLNKIGDIVLLVMEAQS